MAIPKKGSRKIICRGHTYRWRVHRERFVSDWKQDPEKVDPDWLAFAQQYQLGAVADIRITVSIEDDAHPVGRILLHVFGTVVDGFLGFEHAIQIQPKLIAKVIQESLEHGWDPQKKQELRLSLYQVLSEPLKPVMLIFEQGKDKGPNYPNKVVLL
jgi:hypothetical protein